ncbi:response regulator [Occallatibacter savannae]|uniref:response regulator n=1 Tax=Occallatibacter savannae TaxID=1002691 RepID=UPI000D69881C|nr:response regulator [Occallatibacter savannae]
MSDFAQPFFTGSRFYAADEPTKIPPEAGHEAADPHRKVENSAKVLVVDDQRLIADTLAEILNNTGFDAVAAYDGFDALDKASRFHPHWIVTDVLMPRMNGVELAIALRKNYPSSSILLFSGQAGISDILNDGYRQGYQFELLAKPIHPMRLIERLKQN